MQQDDFQLPVDPPLLAERVKLTPKQVEEICQHIASLSRILEEMPIVLSQQGDIICAEGVPDDLAAEQLARSADRLWDNNQSRLSRELIRFEEALIEEADSRANFRLYSLHIFKAITLTVGWQLSLSLTQLRAEAKDTRAQLLGILNPDG